MLTIDIMATVKLEIKAFMTLINVKHTETYYELSKIMRTRNSTIVTVHATIFGQPTATFHLP